MSYNHKLESRINLFVENRISRSDAERQLHTADVVLRRLNDQAGIVIADEVGMGKTFVALAVAASVSLADPERRPVVVMVPSTLKDKWPNDFGVFREKCLPEELRSIFSYGKAETAVDFLKFLDDPLDRRRSVVFLTHGAMSRGLTEEAGMWVKLALIQKAFYRRRDTDRLKKALGRIVGRLLRATRYDRYGEDFWNTLLDADASRWMRILKKYEVEINDDPVPQALIDALKVTDISTLYDSLREIPQRESPNLEERLLDTRRILTAEIKTVWGNCLSNLHLKLPLLILDEAHHLKNAETRLASLFQDKEAEEDANVVKGPLSGIFERMIFLTATPFQLGHYELCSVLERFSGISWEAATAPPGGKSVFMDKIRDLQKLLDEAQEAALRLDHDWSNMINEDLAIGAKVYDDVESWWRDISVEDSDLRINDKTRQVLSSYRQAKLAMKNAESALRPWVIRHMRAKEFPWQDSWIDRRKRMNGRAIMDTVQDHDNGEGLPVEGPSLLPFLLSARLAVLNPESRPVFSEGLASSYEAFLYTRKARRKDDRMGLDFDDKTVENSKSGDMDSRMDWYLKQLEQSLPEEGWESRHPKVKATVEKVMDLWKQGEKVLVFCHYIATGKVLRQRISSAVLRAIQDLGSLRLSCGVDEVMPKLELMGVRYFDGNSRVWKMVERELQSFILDFKSLEDQRKELLDVVRRYLRTPTFLVRYFPVEIEKPSVEDIKRMLSAKDESGLELQGLIRQFFAFLEHHCGIEERKSFIQSLASVQVGNIRGLDVTNSYAEDELQGDRSESLLPNVRLVNGTTKQSTRQNLMLTFNTPFYPDILIASSVMSEGVDLHLNCRYVIHHDLCWNPSTLEQRTGRVDRIGAKVERCGKSINIYFPYISETQDEKMFRVVMDRERWFKVVMGEKYKVDVKTTDRLAQRLTFPLSAAEELMFCLEA